MRSDAVDTSCNFLNNRLCCRDGQHLKTGYSCIPPCGLVTVGPSLGCSSNRFFAFRPNRQGALANGADISRTQKRHRCGTTHRNVPALIERLAQAWLNVTHRSSHPDESIRQAHLVWEGQMNPPDGAGREANPVTRWSYA